MKNIPLLIGTILGTLILIVAVSFMFSGDPQDPENGSAPVDPVLLMGEARNVKMEAVEPEVTVGEEEIPENQAKPDENATEEGISDQTDEKNQDQGVITIVEFSDFQCPACKNAAPLAEVLTKSFPGKVKLVFRHFPLDSIHKNARKAAIAAEAAGQIEKDKFWGMHDLLFENQTEWSEISDEKELIDIFAAYAEKLDIDRTQFLERIEDNSVAQLVTTDSNEGNQLGVNSTPTFYVNGTKVSAPQLITTVESLIDSTE